MFRTKSIGHGLYAVTFGGIDLGKVQKLGTGRFHAVISGKRPEVRSTMQEAQNDLKAAKPAINVGAAA